MTGHSLGVAGVHKAIYTLLMLDSDLFQPLLTLIVLTKRLGIPIVQELEEGAGLNTVMSNSFGFGGTNSSLVFTKSDNISQSLFLQI
ncbi:MAG: hypothetical protein Ct9H300mP6_16520 [Gammaproteobacteria bacterium]|nr:MAG: hypothetical protein Ct9H300mP6_16520 [Gammaproteobacteria bacterium]